MIYVGIDVAKFSHFASAVNSDSEILLEPFSFKNSIEGFNLLLAKLSSFAKEECLIGLEATGHYAENLVHFLHSNGFNIGIINPIQTDAFRKSNVRKTKNDKIDTFLIAQCLILKKYSLFSQFDLDILRLKSLCRFRFDIIQSKTRIKLQLNACVDLVFPELQTFFATGLNSKTALSILDKYTSPKHISNTRIDYLTNILKASSNGRFKIDTAIALKNLAKKSIGIYNPSVETQIRYLLEQMNLLARQVDDVDAQIKLIMDNLNSPILTIPGISYNLGSIIISEIGDISRFNNPAKLLAYAGLDPSVKQSGCFCATNSKISKRGSKLLRYAITYAAFTIIHSNDTFYDYYTTKRTEGKGHRNAIGHVSNKLVRVIFKILTENIPFNLS